MAVFSSSGMFRFPDQLAMYVALSVALHTTPSSTLGEAIRIAKAQISDLDVLRTWNLLGDPLRRLR